VLVGLSIAFAVEPGEHGPIHDPPAFAQLTIGTAALALATLATHRAYAGT
jgi:hypothetical protein